MVLVFNALPAGQYLAEQFSICSVPHIICVFVLLGFKSVANKVKVPS
jgi:hypothetical protein